jgi:1-acyl-sn-glycerol-3-phosphate acyltransferase
MIHIFSIPFILFWYLGQCIVFPIIILPALLVLKLCNIQTSFWSMATYNFGFIILNLKYSISGEFIKQGFILSNHRTWCDFAYDPYVSDSAIVGRFMAFFALSLQSLVGAIENRMIVIDRNKPRHVSFEKIINYMNSGYRYSKKVLLWPEGTRKSYTTLTLEETKNIIKPGLLKSIYEYKKFPVQIMMSNNKERVFNEKKMLVSLGETVTTELSEAIYPEDYDTFEKFLDKIYNDWHSQFNNLYTEK